jgi:hypothetical protein
MSSGWLRPLALLALCAAALPDPGAAQLADGPIRVPPAETLVRSSIDVADSLFMAMDPDSSMAVLAARLDAAPNDFEALWRAARTALSLGILTGNRDEELHWLEAADAYGDRLMALRPDDTVALVWSAATKGRLAIENGGAVTTARLGKAVWALTDSLLARAPSSPLGNDVRGKLLQEILRLSRTKRLMARLLMGSDPVGAADWASSERHLQRAVAGDPGMVLFYVDLGDTYRLQGKDKKALDTYRDGLAVPNLYPVDEHYKRDLVSRIAALERQGVSGP